MYCDKCPAYKRSLMGDFCVVYGDFEIPYGKEKRDDYDYHYIIGCNLRPTQVKKIMKDKGW